VNRATERLQSAASPTQRSADVIICGGGPAGVSTAIALAVAGHSVVVLERSRYEAVRIGETLPPEIRLPLARLGLWEEFLRSGARPSPGISCVWGQSSLYTNDFLTNPFGQGWHVDRCRFDSRLSAVAAARGVEILTSAHVLSCWQGPSGKWTVNAAVENQNLRLEGRVLVDATGRAMSPVRRIGGKRIICDRMIGLVGFLPTSPHASEDDRRTLVEAVESGWWYSASLPTDVRVVALMTDADLLPTGRGQRSSFWKDQLQRTTFTRSRLGSIGSFAEPHVFAANCSRMTRAAGNGRIAVGDAAVALDPLSSQGVYRALLSGLAAARAVVAHLLGDRKALDDYASMIAMDFEADMSARAEYYDREWRWPRSRFWERRHGHSSRDPT
jgi:flavin-dependent dehydrogenase